MSFHSKRKKILELLPQLITKNEEEGKKMLAKLKVNSFFSEYDNKASNRLKSMISLSGRRYKKLKNGESFKISLGESSEKLKKFSENLLSDTLFFNNELLLKQKNLLKRFCILFSPFGGRGRIRTFGIRLPKQFENCCSTIFTRVDYFTVLFQLSYSDIKMPMVGVEPTRINR